MIVTPKSDQDLRVRTSRRATRSKVQRIWALSDSRVSIESNRDWETKKLRMSERRGDPLTWIIRSMTNTPTITWRITLVRGTLQTELILSSASTTIRCLDHQMPKPTRPSMSMTHPNTRSRWPWRTREFKIHPIAREEGAAPGDRARAGRHRAGVEETTVRFEKGQEDDKE